MLLADVFDESVCVIVYNDNNISQYDRGTEKYDYILGEWSGLIADGYEMPAYGVSLDELTRKDMKCGLWVEFVFDGRCEYNEMPFEKLLVKVEEEYMGFNVVRYMSDVGYSGRCFYIQLNGKNMADFYNILQDI